FCRTVISRHSANWPPNENVLAEEIVDFFGIGPFLTLETLVQLCRDHLRIPVSFIELPTELRGYNCSYGNKREIVVSQHQTFLGVGGLAYLLGCALRPYLEDVFASEELRQRNLHT